MKALEVESQLLHLLGTRACPQVGFRVPRPPHPSHGANTVISSWSFGGIKSGLCVRSAWRVVRTHAVTSALQGSLGPKQDKRRLVATGVCGPGPVRPGLGAAHPLLPRSPRFLTNRVWCRGPLSLSGCLRSAASGTDPARPALANSCSSQNAPLERLCVFLQMILIHC